MSLNFAVSGFFVKHSRISGPSEGRGHPGSLAHFRQSVSGIFSLPVPREFSFICSFSLLYALEKLTIPDAPCPMDAPDALIARMIRIFFLVLLRFLSWCRVLRLAFVPTYRLPLSLRSDLREDFSQVVAEFFTGFKFSASIASHRLHPRR